MLVNRYYYGYSNKKKHVTGKGFVDSLSSIFNTIKSATAPVLKTVGNYVSENKDLIAKPILGALGSLAATGLATGIPTIISSTVKPPRGIAQTQSWFIQSSGTTNMLSGISFADANNGVGVGFSSS